MAAPIITSLSGGGKTASAVAFPKNTSGNSKTFPSPGPRRIRERGQCPERLGQGLRVSRGIFGKGDGTCRFSTPTERGNNRCGHGWTWLRVFACGVRLRVLYI